MRMDLQIHVSVSLNYREDAIVVTAAGAETDQSIIEVGELLNFGEVRRTASL